MKTLARKIITPVVWTLETLWNNAALISFIAIQASAMCILWKTMMRLRKEADENNAWNNDAQLFVDQYHMLPDKGAMVNGQAVFSCDGYSYHKVDGRYQLIGSYPELEMGKAKDKTKNRFSDLPEGLEIDGKPLNITVAKWVDESSEIKVEANTSKEEDASSHSSFKSIPDMDWMKYLDDEEECTELHSSLDIPASFLRQKRPVILYEDGTFMMNERRQGQESLTHVIKNAKCKRITCKQNSHLAFIISKFYEQRYASWEARYTKGLPLFQDDEDETPKNVIEIFREEHPEAPQPDEEPTMYERMIEYQQQLMQAIRGRLVVWFTKIYEVLCEKWAHIISFICLLFALYHGYKYYYSEEEGITLEPEFESSYTAEPGRSKAKPNTRTLVRHQQRELEMKLVMNNRLPNQVKTIGDLILDAKFTVSCAGIVAQGFVIMNNIGLMPRHACEVFSKVQEEQKQPIVIRRKDQDILLKQRINMHVIEDNEHGEYVLIRHPQLTGKDIRNHFFTTAMDEVSYPPYAYAVDLQNEEVKPVHVIAVDQHAKEDAILISSVWNVNGKDYEYKAKMTEYMTVTGLQGKGKCGSPLLNPDGKIISIHFAGFCNASTSHGYSYPVFKEYFGSIINPDKATFEMDLPNLKYYSHHPNPPYHTQKSKIRPSAIAQQAWASITQPCIQSSRDPRYKFESTPLLDGASTIGAPTIAPDKYVLRSAVKAVSDELIKKMPSPAMAPPVSVFEAVSAANHHCTESMNLASSAGLPWIADFPGKNLKSDYIMHKVSSDGTHTVELDPLFKRTITSQYKKRLAGEPIRDPFWAHLKDERRKPEKLESFGGTRVFHVAPLEYMIASRRALLPFMDAYQSDPVGLHHAIGLSPDSTQWTALIESLRRKSNKIIQLDFSKFSDSMPWDFVWAVHDVVKNYYSHYNLLTEELENLLFTIFFEMTHSLICVGGDIFEILNGVLQGHPLTAILNTIVNLLEQVYVWILITGLTGALFFIMCGSTIMGDDYVVSVPKSMLKKYNGKTIVDAFAKMLITVTDETKSKDHVTPFQPIQRLTFLSRSYMLHPYRELYLAPADPAAIFDTPLWIRRPDGPFLDATRENVEAALMNCFGHGPCIYEMYRGLLEFLTRMTFRTWFELDYIFYKDEGAPRRSIIGTNLGFITGTSPKDRSLLGARVGRIDEEYEHGENQYWSVDFLSSVRLDTQGIVTGQYKCFCRYECEKELMKRIEQVEQKTCTPRARFLPFTSQEAGTRILGARIDQNRILASRGCPLTIATALEGVASNTTIGAIDGTRDRVEQGPVIEEEGSLRTVFPAASNKVVTRPGDIELMSG
jgi:hypothetical protein